MTRSTIQPAKTGLQSEIPACFVEVRFTEEERVFLFDLFCEHVLFLSRACSILGQPELVDRLQVTSGLLEKARDCDILFEGPAEFFETYVVLEAAVTLLERQPDEIAPLCNSIRDKLVAAESGARPFVAEPVESEPAESGSAVEPVESVEPSPVPAEQQVLPFSGSSAPAESSPVAPAPAEAVSAEPSPAEPAEPVIPKPSSPSRGEFRMMSEYDRWELLERQRAYIVQQNRLLASDTSFAAVTLREQISQIQGLISAVDLLEEVKLDCKDDGNLNPDNHGRLILAKEIIESFALSCLFEEYRSDILGPIRAVLRHIDKVLSGDIPGDFIHEYIDAFNSDVHFSVNMAMKSLGRSNYF